MPRSLGMLSSTLDTSKSRGDPQYIVFRGSSKDVSEHGLGDRMMTGPARSAKINIKLVIILAAVLILLGAGAFTARHVRRRHMAAKALKAGLAAYEKQDWPLACERLHDYLSRYPDDVPILKKYARAHLSVEPLTKRNILGAIGAYRRLMNLTPDEEGVYENLAKLYLTIGDHGELSYVAEQRCKTAPNDPKPAIWMAKALIAQRKLDEAHEKLRDLVERALAREDRKHREYIEACTLLSLIASERDTEEARAKARKWAGRGVEYDPTSPEARVCRARFLRENGVRLLRKADAYDPPAREPLLAQALKHLQEAQKGLPQARKDRRSGVAAPNLARRLGCLEQAVKDIERAVKDLEHAEALKPADPHVRLTVCAEWMEHGELGRGATVLESLRPPALKENADQGELAKHRDQVAKYRAAIREYYIDFNDFVRDRFLLSARLSICRKSTAEGAALADRALEALELRRHRVRVLPASVSLYVAGKRARDARRCLEEYLELIKLVPAPGRSPQRTALLKAMVARAERKPFRVIEILEPMVGTDPSDERLWKVLAEAYSWTDQPRLAIRALVSYLKLKPRDPDITLQLAREYIKQRDWNRALETARLAEPLDPTDIVIRLLRLETSVYVAIERPRERRKPWLKSLWDELVELRKEHPKRLDIRLLQAYIAYHQERVEDSIKELRLAIKECEQTLRAELQLARVYFRAGRIEEALEVCRDATRRHRAADLSWQALAELQRISKQNAEARATLEQGLKAVVGRWEKRALTLRLAIFQVLDGQRKAGIELLQGLAAKDKRETRARDLLLSLREVLQDTPAAQKLIDEIHEVQGGTGLLWRLHQASLRLASQEWRAKQQDISALLERCMESDPGWPAPALMLARMYEQLGSLDRAEAACRRVLRANPAAVEVADRLVILLERQERYGEAKEVLDQLEASPRILSARRVRAAIGRGDFAQAIDELKLRIANDEQNQDAGSRILLARLVYWETKNLDEAVKFLGQAEAILGESMAITTVRVEIVRAEALRAEEEGRRMEDAGRLVEAKKRHEEALERRAEARRILDKQVAKQQDFAAYLLRGSYLASIGDWDPAEKDYRRLTTFKEHRGKGYEYLGQFYVGTKRLDPAVAELGKGVKAYPEDLALKRRLMKTLLLRKKKGDRARAERILGELEKRLPDDPDLLWVRSTLLLAEGAEEARERAAPLIGRVVQLEPTAINAHLALIAIAMRKKDYRGARDLAIRAQGPNPGSLRLVLARARAEQMLNNLPMAASLAGLVSKEAPGDPDAREILVHAALALGDADRIKKAQALIAEAMKKKPEDPQLLGQSAALYGAAADLEEAKQRGKRADELRRKAIALYEQAIQIAPNLVVPRLGVGSLAFRLGDIDRAERAYRRVLELEPQNILALNDLAWALKEDRRREDIGSRRKRYKEALALADKGIKLAPANRNLHDTRGVILCKLGRFNDARKDFETCVKLADPRSPARARALLQLGRTCAKLNDNTAAKRCFEEALQIDHRQKVFTAKERSEIDRLLQGVAGGTGAGKPGRSAAWGGPRSIAAADDEAPSYCLRGPLSGATLEPCRVMREELSRCRLIYR